MADFKENLNEQQRKAVEHTDGPMLILAGAGSGKTRTLIYKVAYLIEEEGVPPEEILAVTFTNKAANEMEERVSGLLDDKKGDKFGVNNRLNVGTFHSICLQILKKHAEALGYSKDFLIYDSKDQRSQIKEIMKNQEVSTDQFDARSIKQAISNAKNKLLSPDDYQAQAGNFREKIIAQVYQAYQKKLQDRGAMDFDDLLLNTVTLFKENEEILNKYQDKFSYILVDEYQDTNRVQYLFSRMIAKKHRNICVVGDDAQSIFGWRGADVGNIHNFKDDWEDVEVVKLEKNYRSTSNIIEAAQGIIENSDEILDKELWTENDSGSKVKVHQVTNERHEAQLLVSKLEDLLDSGYNPSDIAVLFRVNAQSRILEESFMQASFPYKIVGTVKFYERKEIKDILSYLRILLNPKDRVSFERIINVPRRGIGDKTFDLIKRFQEHLLTNFSLNDKLEDELSNRQKKSVKDFLDIIEELKTLAEDVPPEDLIDEVMEISGYKEMLEEDKEKGDERLENIKEFKSMASDFDTPGLDSLRDLIEKVSLYSDADEVEEDSGLVNLMTIHAAKGLEFKVVFLVGLEEGMLPYHKSLNDSKRLAEEQRLCYVALTRAKEELHLCYAKQRQLYGKTQSNPPSRFLMQIPEDLLDFKEI